MPAKSSSPEIPLPRGWLARVKSAILHVISFGQFTLAYTRGWAANSPNSRIRLKAELDRAHQEIARLREEIRIKDARMTQISPHRRPHYPPTDRMAIFWIAAGRLDLVIYLLTSPFRAIRQGLEPFSLLSPSDLLQGSRCRIRQPYLSLVFVCFGYRAIRPLL